MESKTGYYFYFGEMIMGFCLVFLIYVIFLFYLYLFIFIFNQGRSWSSMCLLIDYKWY